MAVVDALRMVERVCGMDTRRRLLRGEDARSPRYVTAFLAYPVFKAQ
jgi:hypothetical protein